MALMKSNANFSTLLIYFGNIYLTKDNYDICDNIVKLVNGVLWVFQKGVSGIA